MYLLRKMRPAMSAEQTYPLKAENPYGRAAAPTAWPVSGDVPRRQSNTRLSPAGSAAIISWTILFAGRMNVQKRCSSPSGQKPSNAIFFFVLYRRELSVPAQGRKFSSAASSGQNQLPKFPFPLTARLCAGAAPVKPPLPAPCAV